jgi:hypothetical protein
MLRLDYGDGNLGKAAVEAIGKLMPWYAYQTAGTQYADIAEKTGFASFLRTLYPGAVAYASHTEQILLLSEKFPLFKLPPFPSWQKKDWTDEDSRNMRGQMIPLQWEDIEAFGAYRLLALMEFYGRKLDPARLPPQLICGLVDGYASKAGETRTFSVVYRDVKGRPAKSVKLILPGGAEKEMAPDGGDSPLWAIRFKAAVTVEKGKAYDYHFAADNGTTKVRYPRAGTFLGPYVMEEGR